MNAPGSCDGLKLVWWRDGADYGLVQADVQSRAFVEIGPVENNKVHGLPLCELCLGEPGVALDIPWEQLAAVRRGPEPREQPWAAALDTNAPVTDAPAAPPDWIAVDPGFWGPLMFRLGEQILPSRESGPDRPIWRCPPDRKDAIERHAAILTHAHRRRTATLIRLDLGADDIFLALFRPQEAARRAIAIAREVAFLIDLKRVGSR